MGRIDAIKGALLTIGVPVYHFAAPPNTRLPYVVYGEDAANDFEADDHHQETADQGTVDLYVKTEDGALADAVAAALEMAALAWYRNSIQYEPEAGLLHYEWVWEV